MRRGADAGGEIDACKRFHDNSSATWPIRLRAKGGSADDVTTVCLGRRGSCDCAQDDGPRGSASVRRCGRPRALATGTRHGHSPRASAPAAWHGLSPRPRATAVSLDHLPRPFVPVTCHGHSPRSLATPFAPVTRHGRSQPPFGRRHPAQRPPGHPARSEAQSQDPPRQEGSRSTSPRACAADGQFSAARGASIRAPPARAAAGPRRARHP